MTNKETLYKNIKSELAIYQVEVKSYKKARPMRAWQKLLAHREVLNVVRFLNAYIYFVKHDGKRFNYRVKDCESVSPSDIRKKFSEFNSNINRLLCTFIGFEDHCGLPMIRYNSPIGLHTPWFDPLVLLEYRECFFGLEKVIEVFCKIHEYDGEDKDEFFTKETEMFRRWFREIHGDSS